VTFDRLQEYAAVGYAAAPAVREMLLGPVDGYIAAARDGMARVMYADSRDWNKLDLHAQDKAQLFTGWSGVRKKDLTWWCSRMKQLLTAEKCVRPVVWTEAKC
jgi:hypothetical protein